MVNIFLTVWLFGDKDTCLNTFKNDTSWVQICVTYLVVVFKLLFVKYTS